MKRKNRISAAIIARNEQEVLAGCLDSLQNVADEIVVAIDDTTTDKTEEIARAYKTKIIHFRHQSNFDKSKQEAIDACSGEWILLLDADERLSKDLQKELLVLPELDLTGQNLHQREITSSKKRVFDRHTRMLVSQGVLDAHPDTEPIVAYIFPRLNLFMNKYLRFGGIYPDGVIRFFKKGKAHIAADTLHKQLEIDGRVGWTEGELLHRDSPTFTRYIQRWYRYIAFLREDLEREKVALNPFTFVDWCILKPIRWFVVTYIVRRGFLDGWQGFLFCFFSALRFTGGYYLYVRNHR